MGKTSEPGLGRTPSSNNDQPGQGIGISSTEELVLPPRFLFRSVVGLPSYFKTNLVTHINALDIVRESKKAKFPRIETLYKLAESTSRFSCAVKVPTGTFHRSTCIKTGPGTTTLENWRSFNNSLIQTLEHTCEALKDYDIRKRLLSDPKVAQKVSKQIDAVTGLLLRIQFTSNDLKKIGHFNTRSNLVRDSMIELEQSIATLIQSFYTHKLD